MSAIPEYISMNKYSLQLRALGFQNWATFKVEDDISYPNLINWLRIRYYENYSLNRLNFSPKNFLKKIDCPYGYENRNGVVSWLLSRCVDKHHMQINQQPEKISDGLKHSLQDLLAIFGLKPIDDFMINMNLLKNTLENFIFNKMTYNPTDIMSLADIPTHEKCDDKFLEECSKILRLIHLKKLQELQINLNQMIVDVQELISRPQVNPNLGQVGR